MLKMVSQINVLFIEVMVILNFKVLIGVGQKVEVEAEVEVE